MRSALKTLLCYCLSQVHTPDHKCTCTAIQVWNRIEELIYWNSFTGLWNSDTSQGQGLLIDTQLRLTCQLLFVNPHIGFLYSALKLKTDIILSREEGVICPAKDGSDGRLCFYDVLADHYVRMPESGKRILDLIVQLWSQSFASHIYSLLFHKWVCELAQV